MRVWGALDGVWHVRRKNKGVCDVRGMSDVVGLLRDVINNCLGVLDGVSHVRRKNKGVCDVGDTLDIVGLLGDQINNWRGVREGFATSDVGCSPL